MTVQRVRVALRDGVSNLETLSTKSAAGDRRPMKLAPHRIGIAALALWVAQSGAQDLPWEIWKSPAQLPDSTLATTCSNVRVTASMAVATDRSNSGGEGDNAYPERWLYRSGDEVVVFDEQGPGAPHADLADDRLRYLDLHRSADAHSHLPRRCRGPCTRYAAWRRCSTDRRPPFTAPLVADHSAIQWWLCRSCADHVRLVAAHRAGQCRERRREPVQSERPQPSACCGFSSSTTACRRPRPYPISRRVTMSRLARLSRPRRRRSMGWHCSRPRPRHRHWRPAATLALAAHAGPGWLRGVPPAATGRSRVSQVNLRIAIDGESAVDMPLADFFASAGRRDRADARRSGRRRCRRLALRVVPDSVRAEYTN